MFIARAMRQSLSRRPRSHRPSLLRRVLGALALHRQRRDLMALDDHMLGDIGLTRAQARAEADRSIWDAPAGWRQG